MARIEQPAPQLPLHTRVLYEHSDIHARYVIWAGVGILLGAWIFTVSMYFFFRYMMHERSQAGPLPPARAAGRTFEPPEPRIQASPRTDLQDLQQVEGWSLHSYRWVDRQKGIVSIPIEQAIQMIARRGIPPQRAPANLKLYPPQAGTRQTGFEGKVEPEPR